MNLTPREAPPVSLLRLNLLRTLYLVIVVGLGFVVWPNLVVRMRPYELMEGVVACMLAAFSLTCAIGVRYPLLMLPVLLWELFWKSIWLVAIVVPLWLAGRLDEQTVAIAVTVVPVLIFPFILPWRYMADRYLKQPADRWR
ncbi:hypothetical protein [Roseateles sp. LYH14W]|uniref:DUF2069 domain-containing protein n=1 Tax=Pelomonas parva TaxID=3299032 RepID=A0ABW7F3J0_9BURK